MNAFNKSIFSALTLTRLSAAALSLVMGVSHADQGGSNREREALRRTQQTLHQTQQERDALAGEKTALVQDKGKLEGVLKHTSAQVKGAQTQAALARSRLSQMEGALSNQAKSLSESQAREAALTEQLKKAQQAQEGLQAKLVEQTQLLSGVKNALVQRALEVQTLSVRNQALYATGLDLIELYRGHAPAKGLSMVGEQVLGLKEVKTENTAQAYRDMLEESRFKQPPTSPTASISTDATSSVN